jgi:acylphosphatase
MDEVRVTALVSGRVQGVGFRYWVREQADAQGLAGSATNLRDGRVEVIAEGPRDACQVLMDALESGRTPGVVSDVSVSWGSAEGLDRFRVG